MNFKLWGLAALSLAFFATSCTKETVEKSDGQNNQIIFSPVLGKQTKATEMTQAGLQTASQTDLKHIQLVAYPTGNAAAAAYIAKQDLTYNGTNWVLSSNVVQPGYSLTYYAWHPATTVTALATSNGTGATLAYTVENDPDDQEDLIATATATTNASVPLTFNHLLSQVNFAVQGILNVKVEITNLAVNTVKNQGTYTFSTSGAGTWGATASGSDTYTYPLDGTTNKTTGANANISYLGNNGTTHNKTNALMLMPQTFDAPADGTFSFTYTLKDLSNNVLKSGAATGTATVNLCDFTQTTWEMGKRYLYIIDFTDYLLGGNITFTVDVSAWVPADSEVAQTIQAADASQGSIEAAIASHAAAKTASLTVFPITVPLAADLAADITITTIASGFAQGDVIRIETNSTTSAGHIKLSATGWTRSESGKVVIFTKD